MTAVTKRCLLVCGSALMLVGMVGCGGPFDASVHGVLTLDGEVVPTGAISFVPTQSGPQAYAVVDTSGNYEVFTGREAGLPSGEYQVAIVARKQPESREDKYGGPAPPGEAITPRWYASPTTSGLTFKVEPGSNEINLDLTSTPPPGWQEPARRQR